jgi:hypothetical protein
VTIHDPLALPCFIARLILTAGSPRGLSLELIRVIVLKLLRVMLTISRIVLQGSDRHCTGLQIISRKLSAPPKRTKTPGGLARASDPPKVNHRNRVMTR